MLFEKFEKGFKRFVEDGNAAAIGLQDALTTIRFVKRGEAQLFAYEEKLGLMRRFREVEDGLDKIAGLAAQIAARSSDSNTAALAERIAALAGGLKE